MATYNGELYIAEQLQSILTQLGEDDEIVISDDGSIDATCEIIEAFHDKRIRLIHSQYSNATLNFEHALEQVNGDIIFLSDQDDVWLDGKVEKCVEELKNYDLVVTNCRLVNENLETIHSSFFDMYNIGKGLMKNLLYSRYYGSSMAFRRSLLEKAMPFPPTAEIGHDLWLGLVAESVGRVKFIETPFLLYRRHKGTVTQTDYILFRSKRSLKEKLKTRYLIIKYILQFRYHHAR